MIARLHRERVLIWRDTALLADHGRAPDGAHQRIVIPEHFAALLPKKRRAQTMLERQALLGLGESAVTYVGELSRRHRESASGGGEEVGALYALYVQYGQAVNPEGVEHEGAKVREESRSAKNAKA